MYAELREFADKINGRWVRRPATATELLEAAGVCRRSRADKERERARLEAELAKLSEGIDLLEAAEADYLAAAEKLAQNAERAKDMTRGKRERP